MVGRAPLKMRPVAFRMMAFFLISGVLASAAHAGTPTNVKFTEISSNSVTLSWTLPSGATPFMVLAATPTFSTTISSAVGLADQPTTSYYLLSSNTTHWFKVKVSTDLDGYSTPISTITLPARPSNAVFDNVYCSSFSVKWEANGNSAGTVYLVKQGRDPTCDLYKSTGTTTLTEYEFTGVTPNTRYYARVQALGYAGDVSKVIAAAPASTITFANPPAPAVSTFSLVTASSFTAHWDVNSNPPGTQYIAQISTNSGFSPVLDSSTTELDYAFFDSLILPNTEYFLRVAAIDTIGRQSSYTGLGSTITSAALPGAGAPTFSEVHITSMSVGWTDGGNPGGTEYFINVSTSADLLGYSWDPSVWVVALASTVVNLNPNTAYYFGVKARNSCGRETEYAYLDFTKTLSGDDLTPPTITNQQTGDDTWRKSNDGYYKVRFKDTGGSKLARFEVRVATTSDETADANFIVGWTTAVLNIDDHMYTNDWPLPESAVWNKMIEGVTNYVSVMVYDNADNSAGLEDVFYVLKDTTLPKINNNMAEGEEYDWRSSSGGNIYNVDFMDSGSKLQKIEYSASNQQGSANGGVLAWTDILPALAVGSSYYIQEWGVDFAGLTDGDTNYISVRAYDKAGNMFKEIDVFKILKYVGGPKIAVTSPYAEYVSSLSAITGTASPILEFDIDENEITIEDKGTGKYWDGDGFDVAISSWLPASGKENWSYDTSGISWVNNSSYTIVARSSDTAGKYSSVYSTATFTFDTGTPSAGIEIPANASSTSSLNVISGTAEDVSPPSGISLVNLSFQRKSDDKWWNFFTRAWSDTVISTVAAGGTSWAHCPDELLKAHLVSGASYYVTVRARDNAVPANISPFGLHGSTFTFVDTSSPAAVTDLEASPGYLPGTLEVRWSAPGDDGPDGMILYGEYRIQYSTFPEVSWSTTGALVEVISTGTVRPGSPQGFVVEELRVATTYYLRLWTQDDAMNWSPLSNAATGQSGAAFANKIMGHVVQSSSEGITGVLVEAYDSNNVLRASDYTGYVVYYGSGSYILGGLSQGLYKIQATWFVNGIASTVSKYPVPMGLADIDFTLEISYELGSISILGINGVRSCHPARDLRSMPRIKSGGVLTEPAVELYQRGKRIALAGPGPDGRATIFNLLPGKYSVRAFNGLEYTPMMDVVLAEGQALELNLAWDMLSVNSVYAFPNPARDSAIIRFETHLYPFEAQVIIFDIAGIPVREICGSRISGQGGGVWHAAWDLRNSKNQKVASGIYLFMVKIKNSAGGQTKKVIKKLAVIR